MKTDLPPLPDKVPAKRRQIEALPDLHIAMWLAGDTITPSQRRRLEEEKRRRKMATHSRVVVGVLTSISAGVTPEQLRALHETLQALRPSEIVHPGVSSRVHTTCRDEAPTTPLRGDGMLGHRLVVRAADQAIALPHETTVMPYATPGVWSMIGLARHRGIPTRVFLPNGEEVT